MTQEDYRHPIEPPPWRVQEWGEEAARRQCTGSETDQHIAVEAAQWGADQELDACLEWVCCETTAFAADLKAARRPEPKPPSLKEQALEMLENTWKGGHISNNAAQTIRRALEQLPDNE